MQLDRDLGRCKADLWFLCYDILGYRDLSTSFHKPMMRDMDLDRRNGVEMSQDLWPRGHFKSTIVTVGQTIQDILIDPDDTILICHAVDDEVKKLVEEIGQHFLSNPELRRIAPGFAPKPRKDGTAPKWLLANKFTVLNRTKYNRQATVFGKSAGAEITGVHVNRFKLDDICGRNTIEDSGLPKLHGWVSNTLANVLNPGGKIRHVATRWHEDDPAGRWIKDKNWVSRVRAALETGTYPDHRADHKGALVFFSKKDMEKKRAMMNAADFDAQMMNDPSPSGDKPWDSAACEHYMSPRQARSTHGSIVVLHDPAPARQGSAAGVKEKERADGSKDDWAIAVVKRGYIGQRDVLILLDGDTSKDWTTPAGFDRGAMFQNKYNTPYVGVEQYGGLSADYQREATMAADRANTPGRRVVRLGGNAAGAKNVRFANLAGWAAEGRFYISEGCPPAFVEKFLSQARDWRPIAGTGRNTLKYDDAADIVARGLDPELDEFVPTADTADWAAESDDLESRLPPMFRDPAPSRDGLCRYIPGVQ